MKIRTAAGIAALLATLSMNAFAAETAEHREEAAHAKTVARTLHNEAVAHANAVQRVNSANHNREVSADIHAEEAAHARAVAAATHHRTSRGRKATTKKRRHKKH